MALINIYVDPDAIGTASGDDWTNAYTSLMSAEGRNLDLVTDTDNVIVHCRSSSATADVLSEAAMITWNGWSTSAAYDVVITCDADDRHAGKWDVTKYRVIGQDAMAVLYIRENFVTVSWIQMAMSAPTANGKGVLVVTQISPDNLIVLENLIIKGHSDSTYYQWVVFFDDAQLNLHMSNCYTFVPDAGHHTSNHLFRGVTCSAAFIYNCSFQGSPYALRSIAGTWNVKNCWSYNAPSGSEWVEGGGALNVTFSASEDLTADDFGATGCVTGISLTGVDFDGGDPHLVAGDTDVMDVGTNLSGDGDYPISIDIDNVARSGTWDMGCDEYVAAGGVPMAAIVNHYKQSGVM